MTQRRVIGWDTETHVIAPGMAVPRMVCLSWDGGDGDQGVILREDGLEKFWGWITDPMVDLVAHHAPYDLGIMAAEDERLIPYIYQAFREKRLFCSVLSEKMIENGFGELKYDWDEDLLEYKKAIFTLQRLVKKHFDEWLGKGDETWQKKYAWLANVPIEEWPIEAYEYALMDSVWGRRLHLRQNEVARQQGAANGVTDIPGYHSVVLRGWSLMTLRSWGARTDPGPVAEVRKTLEARYEKAINEAIDAKMVRPGRMLRTGRYKEPSRDMKAIKGAVVQLYTKHGLQPPLSDSGKNISTSRETLTAARYKALQNDPLIEPLKAVAEVVRVGKLLTTYLPVLESGTVYPITPEWNTMVETYRTSCAKPNLQNLPRDGDVRSCFVPREGWIYAFCDYDTLEMRTLAQTCIDLRLNGGVSVIAELIRQGKDLHVATSSEMMGISYEEAMRRYEDGDKVVTDVRQGNKITNYGASGGMGPDALMEYARGYGQELTRDQAVALLDNFKRTLREMPHYFAFCSSMTDGGRAETVVHPRTGMVRGDVRYTALCNHFFQHLAAVGATDALNHVVEECLVDLGTPLYGCRPWLFCHDEIGLEIPYWGVRAHQAAMRLQQVMIERMQFWVPDVPIGATVALTRRWHKGAPPVKENGILVPCKPVKIDDKKRWVPDTFPGYHEQQWGMAA